MGEFDLSLISEFRNRPSFYDRSSPRFKDKIYNAHQWQEISNILGFDVSILKDRILQLRNRYNLEKRRIEQLREENPDKFFESPWPLYEHLHFLSDHIRARRSYKKMLPLNSGGGGGSGVGHNQNAEFSNSGSNNSILAARHALGTQNLTPFPNGLLTVKMEEEESEDTDGDTESQNNDSEGNAFEPSALIAETHSSIPPQLQQQLQQQQLQLQQLHSQQNLQHQQQQQQQQQQLHHPTISIRRLDTLRQDYDNSSTTKKRTHQHSTSSFNQSQINDDDSAVSSSVKQPRLTARELKYAAFGNFISSSLLDLPQNSALELVEKFTSDIVKALMEKAEEHINGLTETDQ